MRTKPVIAPILIMACCGIAGAALKLKDIPIRDPFILAEAGTGTYYLYANARSSETGLGRGGLKAYTSRDLENWEGPKVVFVVPEDFWAAPSGAGAPEVHAYNGRYYIFASFHNDSRIISEFPKSWRTVTLGATQIMAGDSPEGPFKPFENRPPTPLDFRTLDGTLYVEDGVPYFVYVHEWLQIIDGTMEALPLKPDLSAAAGEPFHLFKASDAPWVAGMPLPVATAPRRYVTDGPCLYKTKTGTLLMLWSGRKEGRFPHTILPAAGPGLTVRWSEYKDGTYVQALARSRTGKLRGPWEQLDPLLADDSGHGMVFRTFEGKLMLIVHSPDREPLGLPQGRPRLFELEDTGDSIRIIKEL